jgi:hypothetical protein
MGKEPFHVLGVAFVQDLRPPEVSFPLRGLVGQQMAAKGLVVFDLARARGSQPFGGPSVRLQFRHGVLFPSQFDGFTKDKKISPARMQILGPYDPPGRTASKKIAPFGANLPSPKGWER